MDQMPNSSDRPGLHVDSDWKAQAEAERTRLEKLDKAHADSHPDAEPLPPADFRTIVGMLATQALGGLGAYGDPDTKRVVVDLATAQFAIDLIVVLEAKTKGNLTEDESKELTAIINELRSRFVHFAQMVATQSAAGTAKIAPSPGATSASNPGKPKIIVPG